VPHEPTSPSGARGLRVTVFVATVLALVTLGVALGALLPPDPLRPPPEIEALFIDCHCDRKDGVRPEPKERTLFLVLALAAPTLALGTFHVLRRRGPSRRVLRASIAIAALFALAGLVIVIAAVGPRLLTVLDAQAAGTLWGLVAIGVVAWAAARRAPARTLATLGLTLAAATCLLVSVALKRHGLSTLTDWAPDEFHLAALSFGIAQSAAGKQCLIDYVPQYGCHGEFLAPLLRALGGTLDALSTILIALTALGAAGVGAFVWRVTRSAGLTLLALAGLALLWTLSAIKVPPDVHDHYYQYVPLRFVFPALSLALGTLWRAPSPALAAVFGGFGAVALLWNPESGIAVVGSLLSVVAIDLLPRPGGHRLRGSLRATLASLASLAFAFALGLAAFVALAALRTGQRAELRELFHYADVFFLSGWFMLPMPLSPSCWQVLIGIHVASIVYGLTGDVGDSRTRAGLQLGVLGVGTFLYYVGRSHESVLTSVSWPAVPALALLLSATPLASFSPRWRAHVSRLRAPLAALTAAALGLSAVLAWSVLTRPIAPGILAAPKIREHIAFIARTSTPTSRVAVLAMHQGVLLLHARRSHALSGPGIAEMTLDEDMRSLNAQLDAGRAELVYVDRELAALRTFWYEPVRPHLERHFEPVARSRDGRFELLRYVRR
jgi:hypothetical protein